jgi:hypothetical protein
MALFSYIASVEDDSIIDKFLNLVNSVDSNLKEKPEGILNLSDQQKKGIDNGLKDIEEGNVFSYKEVMAELKQRNPKYFK